MKKKIYLDYASTTPIDPRVYEAMIPYFQEKFGNTMSFHSFGREAQIALDNSRRVIAKMIKANSDEIIFTGSATESNNLALKGLAFSKKEKGHIIISSIEHPCIMESASWLEKRGFSITKIGVDKYGKVDPKEIKQAIRDNTILVSVMHASNEIGTIQPIAEIGKMCRDNDILFHTDATQTLGNIEIDVEKMNIDMMTASAHKMYGPKGVGLLFLRKGVKIEALLHGGGQEFSLRSSTVNVAGVVGFAKACEIATNEMDKDNKRISKLRDKLVSSLLKIENSFLNGHPKERLANNINMRFSFVEGESLVMRLDIDGISVSTGSACSSDKLEPSYTLIATGLRADETHGSLRISLGRWTTEEEVDFISRKLPEIIKGFRVMSPIKS